MTDKPAVLFLCVHNAGRSQMAAGWLRHLAGDRVDVFSAGSDPGEHVNTVAGDACPVLPGKRYEDWELADPAGQDLHVVREVRDDIRTRTEALITSLDLAPSADA